MAKPDIEKLEPKPDKESKAEDAGKVMPMDKSGRKAKRKADTFKHFLGDGKK